MRAIVVLFLSIVAWGNALADEEYDLLFVAEVENASGRLPANVFFISGPEIEGYFNITNLGNTEKRHKRKASDAISGITTQEELQKYILDHSGPPGLVIPPNEIRQKIVPRLQFFEDAKWKEKHGAIHIIERPEYVELGRNTYKFTISPKKLAPGKYRLSFDIKMDGKKVKQENGSIEIFIKKAETKEEKYALMLDKVLYGIHHGTLGRDKAKDMIEDDNISPEIKLFLVPYMLKISRKEKNVQEIFFWWLLGKSLNPSFILNFEFSKFVKQYGGWKRLISDQQDLKNKVKDYVDKYFHDFKKQCELNLDKIDFAKMESSN